MGLASQDAIKQLSVLMNDCKKIFSVLLIQNLFVFMIILKFSPSGFSWFHLLLKLLVQWRSHSRAHFRYRLWTRQILLDLFVLVSNLTLCRIFVASALYCAKVLIFFRLKFFLIKLSIFVIFCLLCWSLLDLSLLFLFFCAVHRLSFILKKVN
jgi:hypothetical protein